MTTFNLNTAHNYQISPNFKGLPSAMRNHQPEHHDLPNNYEYDVDRYGANICQITQINMDLKPEGFDYALADISILPGKMSSELPKFQRAAWVPVPRENHPELNADPEFRSIYQTIERGAYAQLYNDEQYKAFKDLEEHYIINGSNLLMMRPEKYNIAERKLANKKLKSNESGLDLDGLVKKYDNNFYKFKALED